LVFRFHFFLPDSAGRYPNGDGDGDGNGNGQRERQR
jgi:hypothetical protein